MVPFIDSLLMDSSTQKNKFWTQNCLPHYWNLPLNLPNNKLSLYCYFLNCICIFNCDTAVVASQHNCAPLFSNYLWLFFNKLCIPISIFHVEPPLHCIIVNQFSPLLSVWCGKITERRILHTFGKYYGKKKNFKFYIFPIIGKIWVTVTVSALL